MFIIVTDCPTYRRMLCNFCHVICFKECFSTSEICLSGLVVTLMTFFLIDKQRLKLSNCAQVFNSLKLIKNIYLNKCTSIKNSVSFFGQVRSRCHSRCECEEQYVVFCLFVKSRDDACEIMQIKLMIISETVAKDIFY